MNKDIFYQYDIYTLERKYTELNFITLLDEIPWLKMRIKPFISKTTELLYENLKYGRNVEVTEIALLDFDADLEKP